MQNLLNTANNYIIKFIKNSKLIPYSFASLFFTISQLTRIILIVASQEETTLANFLAILLFGFLYDLTIAAWFFIPLLLYFTWIPNKWYYSQTHKKATGIFLFIGIILILSIPFVEFFFWVEYKARLNFVAMDYLVYPIEVISFMWESYPVIPILISIFVGIFLFYYTLKKIGWVDAFLEVPENRKQSRTKRYISILISLLITIIFSFMIRMPEALSTIQKELALNGAFSLTKTIYACLHSYHYSYPTLPKEVAKNRVLKLGQTPQKTYFNNKPEYLNLYHHHTTTGEEKRPNVVLVIMESFDARYLETFGNTQNITPNFNKLVDKSLFFDNFYSSGIRTVGGLESITTSRPTLSNFSLLKRSYNNGVTTIGTIFKRKGYVSKYIYPGDSNFDNQKLFFTNNDFEVDDIEQIIPAKYSFITKELTNLFSSKSKDSLNDKSEDIKNIIAQKNIFKTTWGVCDEELFNCILKDADSHYENKNPFFIMTLTCSNHIPFDFPANKVELPVKTAEGAMQYADYSAGKFLEEASTKEWYNNTIFIFVADHCTHRSDNEVYISPKNFHIPLFIYSPNENLVKPRRISTTSCQIDIAPTLFSLLNWNYEAEFIGQNILGIKPEQGCALLATFKNLGLYRNNILTYLTPRMDFKQGYKIYEVKADKAIEPILDLKKLNREKEEMIIEQLYDNKALYQISEEFYAQHLLYEKQKNKKRIKLLLRNNNDYESLPETKE